MPNTRGVLPNRTEFRWRLRKRNKHEVSICTQMMMFSFGALAFAGVAVAGPTGGEIVGGSGAITQDGLATNIDQTSQRLNIDWRTFSTAVDESINFHQPNASAVAINRITGGLPSELRGALTANGRVFVLNDAGVTFYGTSQVNVGALLATTATNLVIADDGQSFSLSGDGYGQVINRGAIDVSAGGFAVLAAPYVENAGVVRADLGQVQLVSANAYTLDLRGDGLITYTVDADTLDDIAADGDRLGVDNTGTLQARSGTVTITARTMSKVVDSVVNLAGVVDASALAAADNGGTVLVAAAGDLNLTGVVRADGGASGNGGHVKTWADGTNSFTSGALISARGGDAAGDGGFVELSGKSVHLRGTVDAGAPNGVRGRLLIDPPTTVTIGDAAQGPDIAISVLEGDASATVSAESAITILDLNAGGVTDSTWNAPGSVILRTTGVGEGGPFPGTITFNDTNDTISAAGFITIDANGTNPDVVAGNLVTTGAFADVTVTGNDLSVASVTTGGAMIAMPGDIVFGASGNIVAGDLSITADIASGNTATASLDMDAAGNIDINGNVSVTATVVEQMNAARPNARVDIAAGTDGVGTLTINGEFFTVSANATLTSNGANIHSANADASARLTAGSDIDITTSGTTLTVAATASLTGIQGSNASASADLDIIAGIGSGGGNVSLTGNTVVMADADLSTGLGTAGLVVASTGGAFSGRVVGSGFATANMFVDANAGTSAVGDVTVTGDITVDADADIMVGNITVNSITVTGSSSFSSFVAFGSDVAGAAFANADLRVDADRNAALNGDVIVTADAHEVGGNLSFMNIVARATGSGNASFIGVNGHVLGTASAFADVDINADGAVNLGNGADDVILVDADATITLGTIDVSGTASVSGVGSWSAGTASVTVFEFPVVHWASASATLDINSAGSNVTMSGDIDVLANADITVGDVHVTGKAFADGGTDGFARASFVAFESNLADWANAEAELGIHNTGGNVAINGPVTVDADATITVAAGNTITINGTASAFADNSGTALAFVAALADEAVEPRPPPPPTPRSVSAPPTAT
ncbi:MAG: filamentous hemagglutinin N-terminal domain-containing protein [Alphaproteobacteria bacterium]